LDEQKPGSKRCIQYDPTVWYQDFYNMFLLIMSDGNDFDTLDPTQRTTCSCMVDIQSIITDAELRIVCKYLLGFGKLTSTEQHILFVEWIKYGTANKFGGREHKHKSSITWMDVANTKSVRMALQG
jgi:hypothetical protein